MPLHVIGLGVSEQALLDDKALSALHSVSRVIGSERQLDTVRDQLNGNQKTEILPKLEALKPLLEPAVELGESIALLASGDPLFYGIGKWVANHFAHGIGTSVYFYPAKGNERRPGDYVQGGDLQCGPTGSAGHADLGKQGVRGEPRAVRWRRADREIPQVVRPVLRRGGGLASRPLPASAYQ